MLEISINNIPRWNKDVDLYWLFLLFILNTIQNFKLFQNLIFCVVLFYQASDQMEALMIGAVESKEKQNIWQNSLDQLHQTIRLMIKAQKDAR